MWIAIILIVIIVGIIIAKTAYSNLLKYYYSRINDIAFINLTSAQVLAYLSTNLGLNIRIFQKGEKLAFYVKFALQIARFCTRSLHTKQGFIGVCLVFCPEHNGFKKILRTDGFIQKRVAATLCALIKVAHTPRGSENKQFHRGPL